MRGTAIALLFLGGLIASQPALSVGVVDPFERPVAAKAQPRNARASNPEQSNASDRASLASNDAGASGLQLSGILRMRGAYRAVINGRPVGRGDRVNDYRVISIDARSVELRSNTRRVTMDLGSRTQ